MIKRKLSKIFCLGIVIILVALTAACSWNIFSLKVLAGDGNEVLSTYDLQGGVYSLRIYDIKFSPHISGELLIDESQESAVVLKAEKNIADAVSITVDEQSREITIKGDSSYIYKAETFVISIGATVDNVLIDGSFEVNFNIPSAENFEMKMNGAFSGEILLGKPETVGLTVNGAGSMSFTGECRDSSIKLAGASSISALGLLTENTSIVIEGSSSCEVYVTGILNVKIAGVGNVLYDGSPKEIHKVLAGVGSVNSK